MRRTTLAALMLCLGACRRPAAPPPPRGEPLALPDTLAGFTASPPEHGPTSIRRTYARGATRVDATLAIAAAPLDAGAGDVNRTYQCNEARPPSCDLLIQMRSGVHLELRGGGTSSRADVDALARALPLAAWGAGRIDDPH